MSRYRSNTLTTPHFHKPPLLLTLNVAIKSLGKIAKQHTTMEKLDTREELSVDKKSPPIPVHQRLFKQDTVNSLARRRANLKVDSLDLSLSSVYNHEADLFLNRKQTVLQMVNSPDNPIKKRLFEEMKERQRKSLHHPLIIGKYCLD